MPNRCVFQIDTRQDEDAFYVQAAKIPLVVDGRKTTLKEEVAKLSLEERLVHIRDFGQKRLCAHIYVRVRHQH